MNLPSDQLLVVIILDSAGSKNVPSGTVLILTVLKRQLAESSNHVLNRRVLAAAVLAAKGVKPCDAVKQIVHNGDDDSNTDGVSPDDNNGNNVNPAVITEVAMRSRVGLVRLAGHPPEQCEDGGESVRLAARATGFLDEAAGVTSRLVRGVRAPSVCSW